MPAHLLLVNPSTPRRRLGGWGETLHRAPGFSGLSRFSPQYFAAPVRKRRKRRNAAGAVAAVVNRRKNPKKRKAMKARALGAKKMAKKKKKVNSHAKKVRAFMRKHPRATLAKASKAVAKGKRKSRRKKRRKNPHPQTLAIRRARAAGRGPGAVAPAAPKRRKRRKARKARKSGSRKIRRSRKSSKARKSSRRRVRRMRRTSSAVMRRRSRRVSKRIKRLNRRIAKIRVRARGKGRKAKRARALLVTYRARKSALGVKKRAMKRGFAGGQYARSHGLTRVNPSVTGVAKDLMALLPEIGAGVGSLVLLAVVGNKVMGQLPDSVKSKVPENVKPWLPTISTGVLAAVAYGALRMSKNAKLSKLSVPVLIGGAAATALHAMVAIKVKNSAAGGPPEISLAQKLGLPMGEFVGVSGYVDVNGQMVAVNGLGEFVGVSGMMMDASGQNIAVNGMGEYLAEEVGLGAAGQGIFTRSSLGMLPDGSAAQEAGMGREWSHGLSEEVGAESILDDGGSLSGSIFDD